MNHQFKFHGIIPPVVTLFDEKGSFDWEANRHLADSLIGKGVTGILLMGSTGEFSSLSIEERQQFSEKMCAYVNGRVPVLIGTGSSSLKDTLQLSQHAESIGADGILVVNPYYWKFNDEQLYEYYLKIADSVNLPIMLYNIPQLTGQTLTSPLIKKLALSRENIVGIKETVSDIGHIREVILNVCEERPDFAVFSAFDDHLLPALQLGSAGSINGTAIFAPELSVNLYKNFQEADYHSALNNHRKLVKLMKIYELSSPFFLGIKEAVNQCIVGSPSGSRFPTLITEEIKRKVRGFLEHVDL